MCKEVTEEVIIPEARSGSEMDSKTAGQTGVNGER